MSDLTQMAQQKGTDTQSKTPSIEVRDLHKYFGDNEVLKGVGLKAYDHDVLTLIGSSGSGKSTFLRCINLLETPSAGEIYVGGELIKMKTTKNGISVPADIDQVDRIRTQVGMVFQGFNLWSHMTVLENIIEGPCVIHKTPKKEAIEHAESLLERVGMVDRRHHFPAQISGGQKQRTAIARTLAMDPKVMLFDEPTSALDPELVGEVLDVIRDLAEEGRTMIIVTHEMGFAREISKEVLFLNQGQIEEQGPPNELFTNPKSQRCKEFVSSVI
jgi:arginine/ornithine transport system ATP-binding protein